MAGYGEVYTEVEASVVNGGISTLSGSGAIGEEGDAGTVVVWLLWQYDESHAGFTGKSWYWDEQLNPLADEWAANCPWGYETTEAGFNKWLRATNPPDLNIYLGNWAAKDKADFCEKYSSQLGIGPGKCIEYRGY